MLHDPRAWIGPALGLLLAGLAPAGPESAAQDAQGPLSPQETELVRSLAEQGVHLAPRAGLAAIGATVEVVDDLLEYLVVGPAGARHETVFTADVRASVLNVALLTLGAEPGRNASWAPKQPPPTEEQLRAGTSPYDITPPSGSGFYLYAGWRRGEEVFFFRIEDLVRNLATGQTMRRHRWVYLGSRMLSAGPDGGEEFAADVYQNLVNIAWFSDGNTLLTGALEECLEQTIWMSNAWLLPARGERVLLVFSRERLERAPDELVARLPDVGPASSPYELDPIDR
jgi:hypothetical protein